MASYLGGHFCVFRKACYLKRSLGQVARVTMFHYLSQRTGYCFKDQWEECFQKILLLEGVSLNDKIEGLYP